MNNLKFYLYFTGVVGIGLCIAITACHYYHSTNIDVYGSIVIFGLYSLIPIILGTSVKNRDDLT
jgi:hypothetical protein